MCKCRESKELSLSHQRLCQPKEEELRLADKVGLESGWNSACSILEGGSDLEKSSSSTPGKITYVEGVKRFGSLSVEACCTFRDMLGNLRLEHTPLAVSVALGSSSLLWTGSLWEMQPGAHSSLLRSSAAKPQWQCHILPLPWCLFLQNLHRLPMSFIFSLPNNVWRLSPRKP